MFVLVLGGHLIYLAEPAFDLITADWGFGN
jgi:hypothetical protein